MSQVYEKGTIKVVWIEKDPDTIFSKMFESEKDALSFAKSKTDYLIFKLITHQHMKEFSWKLLPHGQYRLYKILIQGTHVPRETLISSVNKLLSK